jgi:hypothetical protein
MKKFKTGHYNPLGRRARAANQGVGVILRNGLKIMGTVEIKEYELGATFVRMGRVRNSYKNLVRNSEWKNQFCENMRICEDNTNACLAKKCEIWLTGFL